MINRIKEKMRSISFVRSYLEKKWVKKEFENEIKLVNKCLKVDPLHPKESIIHFSINKSATQYVKKILSKIGKSQGMTPIHIHEYAFHSKFPYLTSLNKEQFESFKYLFKPKGIVYSAFGGFIKGIPEIENYNVIICIRDPRDILVSSYYSMAFSHAVPPSISGSQEVFLEKRYKTQKQKIDDFVLERTDELLRNFNNYIDILESSNRSYLVLKYEEMISDFDSWLQHIFDYLGVENQKLYSQLMDDYNNSRPKSENKNEHIRKGIHGDYLNKLQPKTIEILNNKFHRVLNNFGYN